MTIFTILGVTCGLLTIGGIIWWLNSLENRIWALEEERKKWEEDRKQDEKEMRNRPYP